MTRYTPYAGWNVLEHGALEEVDSNLWRLEGTLEGMPLRRVMTIAKRSDGRLVVHSPIAVREEAAKEIEALGTIGFIAVPSGYHRLDVAGWHARYTDAKVVCPRGARGRVEKVAKVDATYDEAPKDDDVALETLAGTGDGEGAMIVRSDGRVSVVLNDLVFNMPHVAGAKGIVLKHVTKSTGGPRVSRIARFALVKDKAKARAELERLADLPGLTRVIVAHHQTIDREPARVLREVARTL